MQVIARDTPHPLPPHEGEGSARSDHLASPPPRGEGMGVGGGLPERI